MGSEVEKEVMKLFRVRYRQPFAKVKLICECTEDKKDDFERSVNEVVNNSDLGDVEKLTAIKPILEKSYQDTGVARPAGWTNMPNSRRRLISLGAARQRRSQAIRRAAIERARNMH